MRMRACACMRGVDAPRAGAHVARPHVRAQRRRGGRDVVAVGKGGEELRTVVHEEVEARADAHGREGGVGRPAEDEHEEGEHRAAHLCACHAHAVHVRMHV